MTIPGIRGHLGLVDTAKAYRNAAFSSPIDESKEGLDDYDTVFKQLFCVAANDLAHSIQEPLANLGILFDDVLETGTLPHKTSLRSSFGRRRRKSEHIESGTGSLPLTMGRGQLLFTVRQASRAQSLHLQSSGYGFAHPVNVFENIARSMEVPQSEIASRLARMATFCKSEHLLEPGVHFACFALRPLLQRGFDVLVNKDARNLLPTVTTPIEKLQRVHLNILAKMDGWTIEKCCEGLGSKFLYSSEDEVYAVRQLYEAIESLVHTVGKPAIQNARLVAQPFTERRSALSSSEGDVTIIAFRTILDVHEVVNPNRQLQFIPLKFYITQQHTYKDTPDIDIFCRRMYREFSGLVQKHDKRTALRRYSSAGLPISKPRDSRSTSRVRAWPRKRSASCTSLRDDSPSDKGFLATLIPGLPPEKDPRLLNDKRDSSMDTIELRRLGSVLEAGAGETEEETVAEKLVALTVSERRRRLIC